ncbi:MAG: penicillin-binding protein 1A [Acidobacteriota bacterium]
MKRSAARQRLLFWGSYGLMVVGAAVLGGLGGMLLGYSIDLPQVEELQQLRPNVVSDVFSQEGRVIGQFALEKRLLVSYDQIPETLRHAILAGEDSDFFEHTGIDFQRLFITALRDIFLGERKGASTLTMQLCKLRFTSSEKRLERKIKDMLFAIETEKKFSKQQIFALYVNQIYMGHGTYGFAAAADFYFGKSLEQLSVAECALLVGILRSPERLSPIKYPDKALRRRAYVLGRMYEEGYVDGKVLKASLEEPLRIHNKEQENPSAYFVEWVRRDLGKNYSTERIWKGGLKIYSTLDERMQRAARQALRQGLKRFDKKSRPWEGPEENILDQGGDLKTYLHPDWRQLFAPGQMVHGLVLHSEARKATVKFGDYVAQIGPKEIQWTEKKRLDRALRPGDVALFSIGRIDEAQKTMQVSLDRVPEVQGALLALDNKTGAIKAMVGGFDFQYSKFNRATQALRQPGSIFKPFTYVVALEEGRSPFDLVLDTPVSFVDALGRPYAPKNSDEKFKGLIPLYQALAESRNVATIRLANALGIEKIIAIAHRFGINRDFIPVLPIALGAGEITLQEISSAFSVFANHGVRAKPYFISRVEDYNGLTLEEHQSEFEQVISPQVASKMLYLLRQVVIRGTARRARVLNRPIVGKTGTTNDATDTWFVGLTPRITAGVWVGYDEKKSLGEEVFGSNLALPIWIDFMQQILKDEPPEAFQDIYHPDAVEMALLENKAKLARSATKTITVEEIPPPAVTEEDSPSTDTPPPPTAGPKPPARPD